MTAQVNASDFQFPKSAFSLQQKVKSICLLETFLFPKISWKSSQDTTLTDSVLEFFSQTELSPVDLITFNFNIRFDCKL